MSEATPNEYEVAKAYHKAGEVKVEIAGMEKDIATEQARAQAAAIYEPQNHEIFMTLLDRPELRGEFREGPTRIFRLKPEALDILPPGTILDSEVFAGKIRIVGLDKISDDSLFGYSTFNLIDTSMSPAQALQASVERLQGYLSYLSRRYLYFLNKAEELRANRGQ